MNGSIFMLAKIYVFGMTGSASVELIQYNLDKVNGIQNVKISLDSELLRIKFDEKKTNVKVIISVIFDLGFEVEIKECSQRFLFEISGLSCSTNLETIKNELLLIEGINQVQFDINNHQLALLTSKESSLFEAEQSLKKKGYLIFTLPDENEVKKKKRSLIFFLISSFFALAGLVFSATDKYFFYPYSTFLIIEDHFIFKNYQLTVLLILTILWFVRVIDRYFFSKHSRTFFTDIYTIVVYMMAFFIVYSNQDMINRSTFYFLISIFCLILLWISDYLDSVNSFQISKKLQQAKGLTSKYKTIIEKNNEIEIPNNDVKKGDLVLVNPHEIFQYDGFIVEGNSFVNESSLTGSSLLVEKVIGEKVRGLTRNENQRLIYSPNKVGAKKSLDQNNFAEQIGKKVSKKSTLPILLFIFIIANLFFLYLNKNLFYLGLLVNIVIFCFIKFFDSLAQFLTTKTGLTKGVLLKNFYKMNSINKVCNIFFDKTGTLTNGIQEIKEVVGTKNSEEDFILMIAASALRETNYPFAEAVIRNSKKKNIDTISIDSIECKNNSGLSVYIDGINFKVGTENFFRSCNFNRFVEKKNRQRKKNNVYISKDNTLIGLIEFYDSLRKESVPTLKKLKSMGSSLTILTGDTMFNTHQFFPTKAGLCETICELSDFEKAEIIKTKNLDGNNSLMVGDGYNDIMALNVADLGIALGSSEKSVLMNADVIFFNDNLEDIFTILEMINKLKISKIFSRFLLFLLIILILFLYF